MLVVEDDPLVAAVIARTLERHGFSAAVARGPADALDLWARRESISLVICDVSAGEMRGPELVARLRQSGRPVRALYVTAYSEDGVRDALDGPVLAKPFAPGALIGALSSLGAS